MCWHTEDAALPPSPLESERARELSECTDTDAGAVDVYGDDCSAYTDHPEYCGHVDDHFSSEAMCCACGGGATASSALLPPSMHPPSPHVVA